MKKEQTIPAKVSRTRVKNHFHEAYSLSAEQVEVLLISSARSLDTFLSALEEIAGDERKLPEIARLGHGLKGVLLNMGEEGWADLARSLERSAVEGEVRNYGKIVATISQGMEEMMAENDGDKDTL